MLKISTNFNDIAMKINELDDVLSVYGDTVSSKIADTLIGEISTNYSTFVTSLGDDPQDRSDTSIKKQRLENGKYRVDISGNQVIYDEFGTGLMGLQHPHPEKNNYSLDPYLSGQTIKYDKNGLPYWVFNYKRTRGVPAGMFVYNAYMNVGEVEGNIIASQELLKSLRKWNSK